jgi:hypothetical protein
LNLIVGILGKSAEDDGILNLFFPCEEVEQSWEMFDEGDADLEVFVDVKGEIFLAQAVFLEEVDGAVVSGWVIERVP